MVQGITRAAIAGILPIDGSMCREKLFEGRAVGIPLPRKGVSDERCPSRKPQ